MTRIVLPTRDVTRLDPAGLVAWYAHRRDEWPVAPRFEPDRRWYARIGHAADHEAWLLTWLPGQSTDLHDHGGSAGAFAVLDGRLTEQVPIGRDEVRLVGDEVRLVGQGYRAGAVRPFGPRHVHRILNADPVPAVSLHIYAPALTRMTRYDLRGGRLEVTAVEREGADW